MRYSAKLLQPILDIFQNQDLDGAIILGLYFLGLIVFGFLSIPAMGMNPVSILMRLICAGFVYLDALNIMAGQNHPKVLISNPLSWKPWFWSLLMLVPVLWILGQPYYLFKRPNIIRLNRIRFIRIPR